MKSILDLAIKQASRARDGLVLNVLATDPASRQGIESKIRSYVNRFPKDDLLIIVAKRSP